MEASPPGDQSSMPEEFNPPIKHEWGIDCMEMEALDRVDMDVFGGFGCAEERNYINTSVTPYSPEVDLSGVDETMPDEKDKAHPLSMMYVEGDEIGQTALRDLLATKYPEAEYPDINKIIRSGLLLIRFFNGKRLSRVLMAGTDRDFSSQLAYQGEDSEVKVVQVNNLDRSQVTYLAQLRTSNKSFDGGERRMNFNNMYGNTMLVYDPRYVQRLGFTSSGLSYFPEGGHKALLAIIRSSSLGR
jgi:hypothetical protein